MACLLVLGLTQCKKNEPINNNNTDDNRVSITLQLTNGGQKVHPEEENGLANVVYDNGDVVYVGSNGKYVGCLTYNGTLFTGSINAEATEGQPLQFIFMGGQTIEGLTENSSTECIFNIGDQSNGLAVISGAASNEDFSLTNLSYTAYLRNKCALVKFDLGETSTGAAIALTGMKTEATVGFDGTVTNLSTTGDITTYGTGSTRYAVVLSDQEAVTNGTVSAEGYTGTFSIPTAAYTNAFLTDATMTLTAAPIGPLATPLTLEALTGGEIVVYVMDIGGKGGGVYPGSSKGGPGGGRSSNFSKKYSVNNGEKTLITTGETTIPVNAGDRVQLYGNGTTPQVYGGDHVMVLQGTAETKVYGNIMSLIDETGYATLTTPPGMAFFILFFMNENLTDASGLLLPATVAEDCYSGMFQGCTGLTTAPVLPATTLAEMCYASMFSGCTSLTAAPELPATTLAEGCYQSMFYGCTSLNTAPVLPATTLAEECYRQMFQGCTSLNNITCLATEGINENNSTFNWVDGVASTGTFNRASGATWPEGANGIPSGWTLVPPADLPAATVTTAPTAKTGVTAGQNEAIVNAGTAEGGTMMYMVNATQPTSTDGFSATVPTAETLSAGTYYVWYYVQGDDSHTDSEISASGIEVTIEAVPDLNLTSPAVGQVIGDDGKNYNYASLPGGVTAVAKICYVSGSNGLALALADEGQMNWSTAKTTCAAHTPAFTGGTWKLATQDEWNNMITAAGSYTDLRDGFSSVGGFDLQSGLYWSSTELDSDYAWGYYFTIGSWGSDLKVDVNVWVRACLAF